MTRYVASGKQVLRNGGHFADVVSPDGASAIARSMNGTYPHQQRLCFTCKKVDGHEPNCADRDTVVTVPVCEHEYTVPFESLAGLPRTFCLSCGHFSFDELLPE